MNLDDLLEEAREKLGELKRDGAPGLDDLAAALQGLERAAEQVRAGNEDLDEKAQELTALRQRYRDLFDLAPNAYLVTDIHGLVHEANRAAATLLHMDQRRLVGKPFLVFVAHEDKREFLQGLVRLGQEQGIQNYDLHLQPRGQPGRTLTCNVTATLQEEGESGFIHMLIYDVTARRRVEQELAALNATLEGRVAERTAQLEHATRQMRQLSQKLVSIQEEERRRISQELHDEAGQMLIALQMGLDALRDQVPPELASVREQLKNEAHIAGEIMERLRALARDLRPPAIDMVDVDVLLQNLCREMARGNGLRIRYSALARPSLQLPAKMILYRFLQEALTNVLRHSAATEVQVELNQDSEWATLRVEDNGQGFEAAGMLSGGELNGGLGLIGAKERLQAVGGKLQVDSGIGRGTRLVAHVPTRERG